MQAITIPLSKPVEHAGTEYKTLTFAREAETGDFAVADAVQGEFSKTLAVIASMAGVPLPAAKKIGMRDFTKIVEKAAPLMGNASPEAAGST